MGYIEKVKAEKAENLQLQGPIETIEGIATVGDGPAVIFVKGSKEQKLQGNSYHLYPLLYAENSQHGESINYTINPMYEHALKKVVAEELSKKGQTITEKAITEYQVIDYIKSLDQPTIEGAGEGNVQGYCSEFRFFVEKIRNQISNGKVQAQEIRSTSIKPDHSFEIRGLKYGYYLLDEITRVEGLDTAASLCMVGTASPNSTVHVKADYPSVIKKIKEDDNFSSPAITDKDGWNDIGDYEIGQDIWYKFVSELPNINGYERYYYAWHDKMDSMLTLNKDSIQIRIQGKDQTNNDKTYTLLREEMIIDTTPTSGDSFCVSVSDIKKIVDREFPSQNQQKEYPYGQKVIVTFSARINDTVAESPGIKAMENDVRLEFSNDPDSANSGSTGFTPWDTVVCYTYALDVKKVNDKNQFLEGAMFRLYSDLECKHEVYVKKGVNGYLVIHSDSAGGKRPENAVEMKSDTQGSILITGIDSGVYYLKEVKAPSGYRVLKEPIEIHVKAFFSGDRDSYVKGDGPAGKTLEKLEARAKITSFYNGITKEENQELKTDHTLGKVNLTVLNQIGKKLPITGNSATLSMVLLGSGLMSYAIIQKIKKKKQKHK